MADEDYKKVVKKEFEFTGRYDRDFNRGDKGSCTWCVIEIPTMPEKMKKSLDDIHKAYDGLIWKGFVISENELYVKPDESFVLDETSKFKIIGWKSFAFKDKGWKELSKYKDKKGYYFVLDVLD